MKKPRPLRKRDTHLWRRHPEDWYVEEEWCAPRLFDVERFEGTIWDPSCGMGRIVKAAQAAGHQTFASDLRYRHFRCKVQDFFRYGSSAMKPNIVSNPPFKYIDAYVAHALNLASRKVALLIPSGWIQANNRSIWLERTPLRTVYLLTPRPSMPPGPVIRAGVEPGNGTTDYAWAVFEHGYVGHPQFVALRRDDPKPTALAA